MTILSMITNLNSDISLIQHNITLNSRVRFTTWSRLIESLSIPLFKATDGLDLKNANQRIPNHPAIDLIDENRRVAVQVTSNATSKKISDTLTQFEKSGLGARFDQLIILGVCDAVRPRSLPNYCTVRSMPDMVDILIDHDSAEAIQMVSDAIHRHQDYSALHPWDDIACLEILVHCIDRPAVLHAMQVEGLVSDMVTGVKEVSELISKGTIGGKKKSKSIDDFQDQEIVRYMQKVRNAVTDITALVNQDSQNRDVVCLAHRTFEKIDELKQLIVDLTNEICTLKGIHIQLRLRQRW